jgi:hypothetical protein
MDEEARGGNNGIPYSSILDYLPDLVSKSWPSGREGGVGFCGPYGFDWQAAGGRGLDEWPFEGVGAVEEVGRVL